MDRRQFLSRGAAGAVVAAVAVADDAHAQSPVGPYGDIEAVEPDENGIRLPEGFTSAVVAVSGSVVDGTDHRWHAAPDGSATFDDGDGGYYYCCNSEIFAPFGLGGVSAIHFDVDGNATDAYPVLTGTTANCAGGPTPWGTWLSCEEFDGSESEPGNAGQVWECDPTGKDEPIARPAMGRFAHEAVAVDPVNERLYLTEDRPSAKLYRFTPAAYPDLSEGLLEAATVIDDGSVVWTVVPDPAAMTAPVNAQLPDATVFPGSEGIWYDDGSVVFTTKLTHQVHRISFGESGDTYALVYDGSNIADDARILSGVDNITVEEGTHDLYVAEDGGNMEIVLITDGGEPTPFLRLENPDGSAVEGSEITGPSFDPSGRRLYFSSQRGGTNTMADALPESAAPAAATPAGITYVITGPFRGLELRPDAVPETTTTTAGETSTTTATATTTTAAQLEAAQAAQENDGGSSSATPIAIGAGGAVVIGAAAAAWKLRTRRTD